MKEGGGDAMAADEEEANAGTGISDLFGDALFVASVKIRSNVDRWDAHGCFVMFCLFVE